MHLQQNFAPDCYKTQEICNKAVNTSPSTILLFLNAIRLFTLKYCQNRYKTQEMCGKAISEDLFILKYYYDNYKTGEMCDKAADDFLPALKYVLDCFVLLLLLL